MNWTPLINSCLYSFAGLLIFCTGFFIIDRITPYNLWQELVEKKNTALAIVVGFVALGLCVIIAAAIHG